MAHYVERTDKNSVRGELHKDGKVFTLFVKPLDEDTNLVMANKHKVNCNGKKVGVAFESKQEKEPEYSL